MATPGSDLELPGFLNGTFDWRVNGFYFDREPEEAIEVMSARRPTNPWIALALIVWRARSGDHSGARELRGYFHAREPFALNRVSILLLGDIGTSVDLEILERAMDDDDADVRSFAASAASLAGELRLVPAMLKAWHRATSLEHHERIGFAISDLLEPLPGPIAAQGSIYNFTPPPASAVTNPRLKEYIQRMAATEPEPEVFPVLVNEAFQRLSEQLKSDRVAIWHGDALDLAKLAEEFLAALPDISTGACITFRHKFEAGTGIDCSRFFHAFRPQPLEIQATLETFLATNPAQRFKPGVRYFFGHPIPDQ